MEKEKKKPKKLFKKLIEMGKKYPIPLWTIIIMLVTAIGSMTLYAIDKDVNRVDRLESKVETLEKDKASIGYVDDKIENHEKVQHEQFENVNNQLTSIKEDSKETKEMVQKLLDLQLKN
jgi:hypothetical protein